MLKRDCGGDGGGVFIEVIVGIGVGVVAIADGLLETDEDFGVEVDSH